MSRSACKRITLTMAALVAAGSLGAGAASADFGLTPGSFSADVFQADGTTPETQAGSHPFKAFSGFGMNTFVGGPDAPIPGTVYTDESLRNLTMTVPAGLVGNPQAVAHCTRAQFNQVADDAPGGCPATSQVGVTRLTLDGFSYERAVYNLEPHPGQVAAFGFAIIGVPVTINADVRTESDYGVTLSVTDVSATLGLWASEVTLWGVPADPSHDAQRTCFDSTGYPYNGCASPADPNAFLTSPTTCAGPQTTGLRLESWQSGAIVTDAYTTAKGAEGCDRLEFRPSFNAAPTESAADSPTGLKVRLSFPMNGLIDPAGLAPATLKDAKVVLPEGLTVNPASAGGLAACGDADLKLGTRDPDSCPDAAKIGTVVARTPLLEHAVNGSVYLRPQASDDPASGEMFRMAIVLRDEDRGLFVKLSGSVKVDPATGRITTEFKNNPQMPVESLELDLKSGPRAPLATPPTCGSKSSDASLASWSGQAVSLGSSFDVACRPGLGGFAPQLSGGTANAQGGAFAPLDVSIAKPDGQAPLNGLSMTLPTGLLAQLKGNIGSQVGTVTAYAGPGSNPFALPGKVFLEGAYGDAPFSMRVVVPAKAGPFDLGEVVVRQKIYVDPITAQVTVVSDPIPTIVKGVPARLQRLDVNVDKAGFVVNPTSCAAKAFGGTLGAVDGQSAPINLRFQASDCRDLDLKPELGLTLSGKGQTVDGKHPAITANLTQKPGQSNLKKVRVALPVSLALDVDNANGLCEFADGSKVTPTCPKASIVGTVTATTPILDEPLTGPVYFVKNVRKDPKSGRDIRTLPKLVIPLTGQNGVKLTLTGTSDVEDDQLVTTFDNIPDAPVSSFKLSINGGKGGILAVSGADICKATQIAEQQVDGQNTKQADTDVYIQTPSCPLKVLSKKVTKSSVAVKVGGLGAGKVTVTGKGIKKTTKTITKSTVATITAKRTKGKPAKVMVSYDPAGPAKARKTTK
jgi:hypothetical protein